MPRAAGTACKPKTSAAVLSPPHGPTLTIPRGTLPHSATSRCDRVIRSRPNCSSRSDSSAKDAINEPGDSARARRRIAIQQPVRRIKHPHHDLRHRRVSHPDAKSATTPDRATSAWSGDKPGDSGGPDRVTVTIQAAHHPRRPVGSPRLRPAGPARRTTCCCSRARCVCSTWTYSFGRPSRRAFALSAGRLTTGAVRRPGHGPSGE